MGDYIVSINDMSNRRFKVGQTIYGKILDDIYTNRSTMYLFEQFENNKSNSYGKITGTPKNKRDYIIMELLKEKFTTNDRAIFNVISIDTEIVVRFQGYEKDIPEPEYRFSSKNRKDIDGIFYVENEKTLTVVGFSDDTKNVIIPKNINGKNVIEIGNYDSLNRPIPIINDISRSIIISEGIKFINDRAFEGQSIESIDLPSTIQYIGKMVFFGAKVKNIDLSKTDIDKIENLTFALSALDNIILPKQLVSICNNAFSNSYIKNLVSPDEIYRIESNAFHNCILHTPLETHIENLEIENHSELFKNSVINCKKVNFVEDELKIIGYFSVNDVIEDQIAKRAYESDYQEIEVTKHIYLLQAKNNNKYEMVIEVYEDKDFDDIQLSYENYKRSISCNFYNVNNFKIDRHLEQSTYEDAISNFKLPKNEVYSKILIRYNDLDKISGITINENYKYYFDDLVISVSHGQEFKPNKEFIKFYIEGIVPNGIDKEIILNKVMNEKKRYEIFTGINKTKYEELR